MNARIRFHASRVANTGLLANLVLLLLSLVNRNSLETDPIQKWVRMQLGRIAGWPAWASLGAFLLGAVAAWFAITPLLRHLNITPLPHSHLRTALEGLLLGLSSFLVWKYLIVAILALSFAAVALIPIQGFREIAFALCVGLLLDTLVARTLLVPALVAIFGRGRHEAEEPTDNQLSTPPIESSAE